MRIVYAGSPEYAVKPLKALVEGGFEVVAVITQPDRPTGRKRILTPTPVKAYAQEVGLPVVDSPRLKDEVERVRALEGELMLTCAYGQILTDELLNLFPVGVYNLHASLLPKFRGASPIQSAILAGEKHTGVTVMKTERALDAGAILMVKRTETGGLTCGELSEKLSALSAEAAIEAVKILEKGEPQLLLQDEGAATFCKKLSKDDARVDFSKSAEEVKNLINAMSPSPAAFCYLAGGAVNLLKAEKVSGAGKAGEVLCVDKSGVEIACGEGSIKVTRMQFAGGKPLSCADVYNGRKVKAGDSFE